MFRKIVSNLTFSPALIGQLGFYAKRLKKEELTRRLGLMFTALALVVQSFAVFTPPEAANASTAVDFTPVKITSVAQYLRYYDANHNNIKDLFTIVGITRSDLTKMKAGVAKANAGVYNWALGKTSEAAVQRNATAFSIRTSSGGIRTYQYWPLNVWGAGKTYNAFVGHTADGRWFGIKADCGNLLLARKPVVPKCPEGTTGTYPNCKQRPKCTISGKTNLYADDPNCKNDPKCTVPGKTNLPANDPKCKADPAAACKSLSIKTLLTNQDLANTNVTLSNGAKATQYVYTISRDGKKIETKTINATSSSTGEYIFKQTTPGTYSISVTVKTSVGDKTSADCTKTFTIPQPKMCAQNPSLKEDDPMCQPCPGDETIWIKDARCEEKIVKLKKATNNTQNADAESVIAKASDQITYTLSVTNEGLAPAEFKFEDDIRDVLEYASVINNGGGTINDNVISWPAVTVKPKETVSRMFVVKMHDQIPASNTSSYNPESYNCKISNTFGNNITIDVDCPAQKVVIEQVVSELPHTGPRENMIFAGITLAIVSYFYARSRQLKKEVRLLRRDFNNGTI